jgi:4-hydroxybenzoate polyprenyltransferase
MGIGQLYRWFNLLSLDIAVGAVGGACYFARILDVAVRPYALVSLGLTVWIIYTTDHLLDARKIPGRASTERHRFHQRHFRTLAVLVVVACVVDFVMILFIKRAVLYGGFLMFAVVVAYLVLHRKLAWLKEVVVAVLYCGGVLLPSLLVTPIMLQWADYVLFLLFFVTALINLLMFSWFDREYDLADRHQSFVTLMGAGRTFSLLLALFVLNTGLCIYGLSMPGYALAFLIPLLMNGVLGSILAFRSWFAQHDRFRLLGDAAFLLPFLYLL